MTSCQVINGLHCTDCSLTLFILQLCTGMCRLAGVQPVYTSVWLPDHPANPGALFTGADVWSAGGDARAYGTAAARPVW